MKVCFIAHNLDIGNGDGRFAYSMIESLQRDFGVKTIVFVERGQEELLGARAFLYSKGIIRKFAVENGETAEQNGVLAYMESLP